MLTEQTGEFVAALRTDLGKPEAETLRTEIGAVIREIDHTLEHLGAWLTPQKVSAPDRMPGARAWTVFDPLGVVLVIAPWNYPVQLLLTPCWVPRIRELRAGQAQRTGTGHLGRPCHICSEYLDADAVAVVEGGILETTALLEQRFDHIFYTGNGAVGRVVMTAAARQLTPVTLELGASHRRSSNGEPTCGRWPPDSRRASSPTPARPVWPRLRADRP